MGTTDADQYPGLPPGSPEAAIYGERASAFGQASALDPIEEISYGAEPGQRLHIYAPKKRMGIPLPVVIFFHGGAWVSGGLLWLRFMAPIITNLPAIFVAGTYRLAPQWRWPTQYEDVRAAIAYAHRQLPNLGGDPARIVVGGHSAGGHLVTLAVLKGEIPTVRACFPLSCSFDLQYGDVPIDSAEGRVYKYLFRYREQDADASPVNFVSGNRTPFHIVWGEDDFGRIVRTSESMAQALRDGGTAVTTSVEPSAGHFDTHLRLADSSNPWYARLREELRDGG